uniref:SWIM-type domain-containing protein n=1 Tax=Plectus sambesii TaxID=2011161 RepID=A0A914WYN3_9BILA
MGQWHTARNLTYTSISPAKRPNLRRRSSSVSPTPNEVHLIHGHPVFKHGTIDTISEAAELLLLSREQRSIPEHLICRSRPERIPTSGDSPAAVYFLVNNDGMNEKDMTVDGFGVWNSKTSRNKVDTYYYRHTGAWEQVGRRNAPPADGNWNACIKKTSCVHPSTVPITAADHDVGSALFRKHVYVVLDKTKTMIGPYAIISYFWTGGAPYPFVIPSHLNTREDRRESRGSFYRMQPSTLDTIRSTARDQTPRQSYLDALAASGGVRNATSLSSIPRNTDVVYNIVKQVGGSKRTSRSGRPAVWDLEALEKMAAEGTFVKNKTIEAGGRLNVFCATDTMLATFKSICVRTSEEIESGSPSLIDCRPLHVDVTFEATKPWVCLACFRQPMFFHVNTKAEPVVPAFFCLICGLQEEDYTYCSGQLKRHAKCDNADRVRCFVTDSERSLINGLEDSTLFQQRPASHILCELHLMDNVRRSTPLRSSDDDTKKKLLAEIFGEEHRQIGGGRYKIGGLVDSKDKEKFDLSLKALKEKWECLAPGFYDWFRENTGAKIREHYVLPTRHAAGRGNNRITNNDQENLNRRMKEELEGPLKPPDQLILIVEQFCQAIFKRLELAVIGQGDYRLKEQHRHLQKTWEEWSEMSADQRAQYLDRHFDFKGATIDAPERKTLSISLTAKHLPGTSPAQLQSLEDAAVALLVNTGRFHDLIDAIGTSVEDRGFVRVVKWDDSGRYRCSSCEQFKAYRFVCAHTLAVAERNGTLAVHLLSIADQFENETAELLLKRKLQLGVGKKPSRRTGHPFTAALQDRTVAVIVQRPIASMSTDVNDDYYAESPRDSSPGPSTSAASTAPSIPSTRIVAPIPSSSATPPPPPSPAIPTPPVAPLAQPLSAFGHLGIRLPTAAELASIAHLKQMNLTEPFHGSGGLDNMFMITTLAAYRGRHKNTFRRCQACDVDLPAPGTVDAPLDIILSHKERYQYYDKKAKKMVWSPKEAEAPLHARYDCVAKRYPFFSYHLIKIPNVTRHHLKDIHKQWLNVQFGYPIV